nr:hypothetical protein [uncultured Rhodopila sp.]
MADGVFVFDKDNNPTPLKAAEFANEADFQALLKKSPNFCPVRQLTLYRLVDGHLSPEKNPFPSTSMGNHFGRLIIFPSIRTAYQPL